MGKTRLIASQNALEAVFSMVYGFIFGQRHLHQLDSSETLAYFFLGAFLLQ